MAEKVTRVEKAEKIRKVPEKIVERILIPKESPLKRVESQMERTLERVRRKRRRTKMASLVP